VNGRPAPAFPVVAALVSLLPDAAAALPTMTYWFRDFTVTFYPLRQFAARELAAGRFPWWNPYVNEGSFGLPAFYPLDLLHVAFPGPAAVSWLLSMHLPLAALAAYALARELGVSPPAAAVSGVVFSVGGLAVSSLNLYVFLQALAWTPLVALTLRRVASRGGRWTVAAAATLAVALSTLAIEFVAQAAVIGVALAWAARPLRGGAARLATACAIGAALAAVPLLTVSALLPETVRGEGFDRQVALGNEAHPALALQAVAPRLFGDPAAPVDAWWGGRFFTKGFPYFLTLYVGPLSLAAAAAGVAAAAPRARTALLVLSALAGWYALGVRGGLAAGVAALPGLDAIRFPAKALLTPFTALALFAGMGVDALAAGRFWRVAAGAAAPLALLGLALAAASERAAALVVGGTSPTVPMETVARVLAGDGVRLALLAAGATALSLAVVARRLRPAPAAVVLAVAMAADLVAAARGVNPQGPAAFFRPLPEMAALRLGDLDGGRVFSYGLDSSPAFRRFLAGAGAGRSLWSFFLSRQVLAPLANVIDGVEIAEGKDLTGFVMRQTALEPADLDPERVDALLPRLRAAAVTRVVSLDPLPHAGLRELARVPAGPPGMDIHVYALGGALPRASFLCGDGCEARLRRRSRPGAIDVEVDAPAPGTLLLRDNYARGWRAAVDGRAVEVRRAGPHMEIGVDAGRHAVALEYRPPGLRAALVLTLLGVVAGAIVAFRGRP
jgi:hypothetical protein